MKIFCCVVAFVCLTPVFAQDFEVSPIIGGRFGGSLKVEQPGQPNFRLDLTDSFSFGVAAGYRFDDGVCSGCATVEFRWMRQSTHLELPQNPQIPPAPSTIRTSATLDEFLADFSREWPIEEWGPIRPLLTLSLGAARLDVPASSATRFAFGVGGGLKVFPTHRWGVQFKAEYLPIFLEGGVQRLVCTSTCTVILNGGLVNQFVLSAGPVIRF